MIKIIRITKPECYQCLGASFGDCSTCTDKVCEVTMCKDCKFQNEYIMHSEKLLCTKLHAWVEPTEFCAWGEERED